MCRTFSIFFRLEIEPYRALKPLWLEKNFPGRQTRKKQKPQSSVSPLLRKRAHHQRKRFPTGECAGEEKQNLMKLRIAGNYREHPQRASRNGHEKPFPIKTGSTRFPRQLPPNHRMKQSSHRPTILKIANGFLARKKRILSMFSKTLIPIANHRPIHRRVKKPITKASVCKCSRMENNQKIAGKLDRTNLHSNPINPACPCPCQNSVADRSPPNFSVFRFLRGRIRFPS